MSIDKNLLADKHPQHDIFICDVQDAVLKDIMPHMEHPFYSLSKKPETNIRRYENGKNWLEVTPSVKGLATIYDKDILIYAISQLMAKLNRGEKVSRKIRINTHELLMFCNRGVSGRDYDAICESIDRLAGTRISTNIVSGDEEQYDNFGLIDKGGVRRKNGLEGRIVSMTLTVSEWVFDAIRNSSVLTLNRDYFRLRKPIERRVYEIARKHCGQQTSWSIALNKLHNKSGSKSQLKEFRRAIKTLAKADHLPDYRLEFDKEKDTITFYNREKWWQDDRNKQEKPYVKSQETYEIASYFAPGEDIHALEQAWINHWMDTGCRDIKDYDLAFIGFVKANFQASAIKSE